MTQTYAPRLADDDVPAVDPGQFPTPPLTFTDETGRTVEIRVADGALEPLLEMYDAYEPDDRAQGIPPRTAASRRSWVETLLADGLNVLAWQDDRVVGHATLVPGGPDQHELAIFVARSHQQAGIGSRLVRSLLAHGAANGVERVWLTVERTNRVARQLYRSTGFAVTEEGVEYDMALRLA
ncbi:MAG: N-acetyltransferase family protein [Haloarculaceae archaeon]